MKTTSSAVNYKAIYLESMKKNDAVYMVIFGSDTGILITAEINGAVESRRQTNTYVSHRSISIEKINYLTLIISDIPLSVMQATNVQNPYSSPLISMGIY